MSDARRRERLVSGYPVAKRTRQIADQATWDAAKPTERAKRTRSFCRVRTREWVLCARENGSSFCALNERMGLIAASHGFSLKLGVNSFLLRLADKPQMNRNIHSDTFPQKRTRSFSHSERVRFSRNERHIFPKRRRSFCAFGGRFSGPAGRELGALGSP